MRMKTNCWVHVCSYACEEHAQGIAGKLGGADIALQRFVESQESGESGALRFPQSSSDYAAGSMDNPIMMSEVQVWGLTPYPFFFLLHLFAVFPLLSYPSPFWFSTFFFLFSFVNVGVHSLLCGNRRYLVFLLDM
jgi:hypothetical protein